MFASSEPVPGFHGETLQLAFIDLRQVRCCCYLFIWFLLKNTPQIPVVSSQFKFNSKLSKHCYIMLICISQAKLFSENEILQCQLILSVTATIVVTLSVF